MNGRLLDFSGMDHHAISVSISVSIGSGYAGEDKGSRSTGVQHLDVLKVDVVDV